MLGLGAFTAVVGDAGLTVAKNVHIPVTTGNSYTVGMALAGIRLAAGKMGLDLKKAEVLVVGANGAIGSACARILAREVNYLTIATSWRGTYPDGFYAKVGWCAGRRRSETSP